MAINKNTTLALCLYVIISVKFKMFGYQLGETCLNCRILGTSKSKKNSLAVQ